MFIVVTHYFYKSKVYVISYFFPLCQKKDPYINEMLQMVGELLISPLCNTYKGYLFHCLIQAPSIKELWLPGGGPAPRAARGSPLVAVAAPVPPPPLVAVVALGAVAVASCWGGPPPPGACAPVLVPNRSLRLVSLASRP